MTPAKQGHRAGAQGSTDPCPFPDGSDEAYVWTSARNAVNSFRAKGLDPNGHAPPPPHICPVNPRHVCNCCHNCTAECRREYVLEAGARTLENVKRRVLRLFGGG